MSEDTDLKKSLEKKFDELFGDDDSSEKADDNADNPKTDEIDKDYEENSLDGLLEIAKKKYLQLWIYGKSSSIDRQMKELGYQRFLIRKNADEASVAMRRKKQIRDIKLKLGYELKDDEEVIYIDDDLYFKYPKELTGLVDIDINELRGLIRQLDTKIAEYSGDVMDKNDYSKKAIKKRLDNAPYPPRIKALINSTLNRGGGESVSEKNNRMVKILLDLPWYSPEPTPIVLQDAKLLLDDSFYGMDDAKHKILKMIAVENRNKKSDKKIMLLAGPPGTGKTALAKVMAFAMGKEFAKISMGGISTAFNLVGCDQAYTGATESAIAQCLVKTKSMDTVILLDEVDKLINAKNIKDGNPTDAMLEILDPNNTTMYDAFLRTDIDISSIFFIATANYIENISKPLLDRMEVVNLNGYSEDEKHVIAREYIIPQKYEQYNLTEDDLTITDSALDCLIKDYCYEDGIRELIRAISDIFSEVVYQKEIDDNYSITLDSNNVKKYIITKTEGVKKLNSLSELKAQIKIQVYPDNIKSKIIKLLDEYDKYNGNDKLIKHKLLKSLTTMPWYEKYQNNNILDAKDTMNEEICGLDIVKDRIYDHLALQSISGNVNGKAILLVGEPGTGKTTIAKAMGKALNRCVEKISIAGERDPYLLSGIPNNMPNGKPGKLTEIFCKHRSSSVVIVLDEIDKASRYNDELISSLINVLDTDNSKFYDSFLEEDIDLTNVVFVATANNISALPRPLLDRMEVILVPAYSLSEKYEITKNYILPQLLESYNIDDTKIKINSYALKEIILSYDSNGGVRDIRKKLIEILGMAARQLLASDNESITIDKTNIDEFIEKRKDIVKYPQSVGLALGVGVHSFGGLVLPVESCLVEGSGKLSITGNLHKVMEESCIVAHTYIKANYNKLGIDRGVLNNNDIHIHFPKAMEKDGPSAGIAIVLSMISALKNTPLKKGLAFTGELNMMGNVMPIGSVGTKIIVAHNNELNTIVVPYANKGDVKELNDFKYLIDVKYVSDIEELVEFAI